MAAFPDGNGLFETILTINGRPQFLNEHLNRAKLSAGKLGWDFMQLHEIESTIDKALEQSKVPTKLGRLRLIFAPDGKIDATHQPYERWKVAARVNMSSSRIDLTTPWLGIKVLPYRSHLEVLALAQYAGFDDSIRLNSNGQVAETAIANILLKVDGKWLTPPTAAGILPGVIRSLAISHLGVEEKVVFVSDLERVESIFLINSLKGFQPVSFVEARLVKVDTDFMKKVASLPLFNSVG